MKLPQFESHVATALTVYGIETFKLSHYGSSLFKLQQLLPFTVLKLIYYLTRRIIMLKSIVATALTVYGIETFFLRCALVITTSSCNSSYRLRY